MFIRSRKQCYFCANNIIDINYKDVEILNHFLSPEGDIISARRKGTCRKHQKKLIKAIERARFMALLPYTTK